MMNRIEETSEEKEAQKEMNQFEFEEVIRYNYKISGFRIFMLKFFLSHSLNLVLPLLYMCMTKSKHSHQLC